MLLQIWYITSKVYILTQYKYYYESTYSDDLRNDTMRVMIQGDLYNIQGVTSKTQNKIFKKKSHLWVSPPNMQ